MTRSGKWNLLGLEFDHLFFDSLVQEVCSWFLRNAIVRKLVRTQVPTWLVLAGANLLNWHLLANSLYGFLVPRRDLDRFGIQLVREALGVLEVLCEVLTRRW